MTGMFNGILQKHILRQSYDLGAAEFNFQNIFAHKGLQNTTNREICGMYILYNCVYFDGVYFPFRINQCREDCEHFKGPFCNYYRIHLRATLPVWWSCSFGSTYPKTVPLTFRLNPCKHFCSCCYFSAVSCSYFRSFFFLLDLSRPLYVTYTVLFHN